jgi:HEAT repeat protein
MGLALIWAGPARAGEVRTLRELTAEASLIAIGQIVGSEDLAEGVLSVHTLDVIHALKGASPGLLQIVEERRSSLRLMQKDQRVLVFLGPAPRHSFFRKHLPAGRYLAPLAGKQGVIELEPKADDLARSVVGAYLGRTAQAADERALLRRELYSGQSRFAADAVVQLERDARLAKSLEKEDLEALKACLGDERIDERTKARLLRLLGEGEVPGAVALLQAFEPSSGVLIAARAEALTQLGFAPGAKEMESYLGNPDPAVRRFGVKRLASSGQDDAVDRLEAVALNDSNKGVRLAAIEALGATGRPEATKVLERTFNSDDDDVRRASARGFNQLGGPAAQESLSEIVFRGDRYEVQAHALVLLFAMGATKEDPAIERIRSEHPNRRIRRMIDEGIDLRLRSDPHPRR